MIRLAEIGDLAQIEAIVAAAYAPYVARIGRKPAPMLDDYAALIGAGRVHVLVHDGVVDGLVVLIAEDGSLLIDNVAIRPDAQRRGHGRTLLDFAERSARAAGYRSIRLFTNAAMTENIALYVRIGFVETHRSGESGWWRVYMAKSLGGGDSAGKEGGGRFGR